MICLNLLRRHGFDSAEKEKKKNWFESPSAKLACSRGTWHMAWRPGAGPMRIPGSDDAVLKGGGGGGSARGSRPGCQGHPPALPNDARWRVGGGGGGGGGEGITERESSMGRGTGPELTTLPHTVQKIPSCVPQFPNPPELRGKECAPPQTGGGGGGGGQSRMSPHGGSRGDGGEKASGKPPPSARSGASSAAGKRIRVPRGGVLGFVFFSRLPGVLVFESPVQ